jgi:hypothetical protein
VTTQRRRRPEEAKVADVKDPVEVLADELGRNGDVPFPSAEAIGDALDELRRRARVERRLDAATADEGWLYLDVSGVIYDADGVIEPRVYRAAIVYEGDAAPDEDDLSEGPDRWTAIDAALDKAGAPKKSE